MYVPPEQLMLDRAEFARKGIARGRSVAVCTLDEGVLFVAENHSTTLNKISEIYDRIGYAAVGRYHEFEMLRIAGIRHADVRGYSYDRTDVTARGLAGAYSQILGATFAASVEKPYEVELVVAELGERTDDDVLYRVSYDGVITDERSLTVIGGEPERIVEATQERLHTGMGVGETLRVLARTLRPGATLAASQLEVGLLDRRLERRRRFRRITGNELQGLVDG